MGKWKVQKDAMKNKTLSDKAELFHSLEVQPEMEKTSYVYLVRFLFSIVLIFIFVSKVEAQTDGPQIIFKASDVNYNQNYKLSVLQSSNSGAISL